MFGSIRIRDFICCLLVGASGIASATSYGQNYRVERVASNLAQPTFVAQAPGDPSNIVYYSTRIAASTGSGGGFGTVNNMGGIFRYDLSTRTSTQIMNLNYRQLTGDEGLVGFSFSPDFNTPGAPGYQKLYVSSSQFVNGSTPPIERVEEYMASGPNGTVPVDGSNHAIVSRLILQYNNIASDQNHTIDWIGFDPTTRSLPVGSPERNYLFISAGDGDINGNAQTRPEQKANSVLGKLLRVDVDVANHGDAYMSDANKNFAIPPSNPIPQWNAAHPSQQLSGTHKTFTGGSPTSADYSPALGEIYFTGTRNQFRMSIDRQTGDIWAGDVGENAREEINFLKAGTYNGTQPPIDFGYASREGTLPTAGSGDNVTVANAVTNSSGATSLTWNLSDGGTASVSSVNPIREGGHLNAHNSMPDVSSPTLEIRSSNRSAFIGGYVYRGPITDLQGKYVWADFVQSNIFMLDFDRNTPLSSYSGTNFNKALDADGVNMVASLGTKTLVANRNLGSLWQSLVLDPTDPSYTSALGSAYGMGRVVSFGEDNQGNLFIVDFGGARGDSNFGSDYPNAGAGEIFELVPLRKGDFTLDDHVTANDVQAMISALSDLNAYKAGSPLNNAQLQYVEDVNGDGSVNNADLQAMLDLLKAGGGSTSAVPEPSSQVLFLLAVPLMLAALFGRHREKHTAVSP